HVCALGSEFPDRNGRSTEHHYPCPKGFDLIMAISKPTVSSAYMGAIMMNINSKFNMENIPKG
ncbi:MAG: hypothetical protein MUO77_02010, partial [Anaerolineales bacterium]|nr:hypothetical protein [Anaerolineales bacterium]